MRFGNLLSIVAAAASIAPVEGRVEAHRSLREWIDVIEARRSKPAPVPVMNKRDSDNVARSEFATSNSSKFLVDGKSLPNVNFDAGESYAGLLPNDENGDLFFWFWPTTDKSSPKEIVIWLNGGPGCSSLEGAFQENGPVLWQSGQPAPVANPWSWHHITNIVYVDQPVGTGYSTGNITAKNENDVARQFNGFWKNFVDTFQLKGYKIYVAGESYAGMYCPYISAAMLQHNDTDYFNVAGMYVNDGVIGSGPYTDIATNYFAQNWRSVVPVDDGVMAELADRAKSCGWNDFMENYLTYPGTAQPLDTKIFANYSDFCALSEFWENEASDINPMFDVYQISTLPPIQWDVLGFNGQLYTFPGTQIYFNEASVKKALHVPSSTQWYECSNQQVFPQGDDSDYPNVREIPYVIEKTHNVMINHGTLDAILMANATLLSIQNMTWGGSLGLSQIPSEPLFVPYHNDGDERTVAGQGVMGSWIKERGLTVGLITQTGHMIPQYVPSVAFRQIQALTGRIANLSSTTPLPQSPKMNQPPLSSLGSGTAGKNWGRVKGGK